jgi:hypothetical protein
VIGRITGAERSGGALMLAMGPLQVATSAIRAVAPDR